MSLSKQEIKEATDLLARYNLTYVVWFASLIIIQIIVFIGAIFTPYHWQLILVNYFLSIITGILFGVIAYVGLSFKILKDFYEV